MRSRRGLGCAAGLLLLGGALGGCRDLDVPPPGPGVAPQVRFVSPDVSSASGSRVAQTLPVTLEALDANGIRSLTLSCGATPLFSWTAAPFIATVDLRPCTGAPDGGTGLVAVTLVARAVDATGMEGSATVEVQVDASAPSVSLVLPERVAPGLPFSVLVKSDRPLAGVPLVSVEGVAVEARALDASTFSATVAKAPGLGVDTWTGTGPPPLSVLEEVERALDVAVEARGLNGNPAPRVVTRTFVSRIAWERSIPGVALGRGVDGVPLPQLPVATAAGLVLPVVGPPSQRLSSWLPVQLRAAGGEARTLPPEVTAGGYGGLGIDALGRVLLAGPAGAGRYYDFDSGAIELPAASGPYDSGATPVAVGDELCLTRLTADACTGLELRCVRPDGQVRPSVLRAQTHMAAPQAMVASGSQVLVLGAVGPTCCNPTGACTPEPQEQVFSPGGAGSFVSPFPGMGGLPFIPLLRALPLEGGGFALLA
ncbi:MAG TPA: hypothetical protein VFO83_09505, partial [Aggregicoccus sp.]|nr:hypothetical protein [Aggregicoccus sp.]